MVNAPPPPGRIGRQDAVRIVPLQVPRDLLALAPAAPPQLTYRGGPLLSAVQVVTLFWGAAWQTAPLAALPPHINTFFDAILVSPLIDALAEYSVPTQTIGHGTRTGTLILATPAPGPTLSDAGIQSLLQQQTAAGGALPAPTPQTLYVVYLPPGTTVTSGGGRSCLSFCGYHDTIAGSLFYAVEPYPGCAGCSGGLSTFAALTVTSSHELCEAITDPVPGQGWYDDTYGEIGDICAWQPATVAGYTVQQEWSNVRGACDGIAAGSGGVSTTGE